VSIDISAAVADTVRVDEGPFRDDVTRHLHWVDIRNGDTAIDGSIVLGRRLGLTGLPGTRFGG
jgi:hypothetical protein